MFLSFTLGNGVGKEWSTYSELDLRIIRIGQMPNSEQDS